jgi:hypothetical protein
VNCQKYSANLQQNLSWLKWGPFLPAPICLPLGGLEFEQHRPVYHTLRWFIANLGEFDTVERISLTPTVGGGTGSLETVEIYAYRVLVQDRAVYVLWAEDGVGQVMGETKPAVNVDLPVSASTITVTHTITQTGQTEPSVDVIKATDGQVNLVVSETPIFVEDKQQAFPLQKLYLPLVLTGNN